jgi:hypothetical protein
MIKVCWLQLMFFFKTPAGRVSLLSVRKETQEFLLSGLLSFTEHPDMIRRGGVSSTLKLV